MTKFDSARLKVQLKMAISRINNLQKKLQATGTQVQAVQFHSKAHKEVADLLRERKDERARLRVKHVIRDDYLSEALEIIMSYCDDLHKSINLLLQSK